MRRLLALVLVVAGCERGIAVRVDVQRGCAVAAQSIDFEVTLAPSGTRQATVPYDAFFAGDHTLLVLPPDGTTSVTVKATVRGAQGTLGGGSATVMVDGPGVYPGTLQLAGGCGGDGGLPDLRPPDAAADLSMADLAMADLSKPDLSKPDLSMADLSMVDLSKPDLAMPDLSMPDLAMADLSKPDLSMPDLSMPDLSMPDLSMPDLSMPDLSMPDLSMPDLAMPDLTVRDMAQPPDMARPPLFVLSSTTSVGSGVLGIVAADFNADGRADVAVGNYNNKTATVAFGNGNGGIASTLPRDVNVQPVSVAAGDFNSDGWPDLAVVNNGAASVSILISTGDGMFAAPTELSNLGATPMGLAVADLDGDCFLDLAIGHDTNANPGIVTVVYGDGKGNFGSQQDLNVGQRPIAVALVDLNHDGRPDVITTNYEGNGKDVTVLLNAGSRAFNAPNHYLSGVGAHGLDVGDFDGDRRPDVVVANSGDNSVAVLLNDGNGGLLAPKTVGVGKVPVGVVARDFDGDGKLDAASADQNSGTVSVLLGAGNGSLGAAVAFAAGSLPIAITSADFDRDGQPDLAVADYNDGANGPGQLRILRNQTQPLKNIGFTAAAAVAVTSDPSGITAADFDLDGRADIATAGFGFGAGNSVSTRLGMGDGNFGVGANTTVSTGPYALTALDWNCDGVPEVALVTSQGMSKVSVLLGNGAVTQSAGNIALGLAAGDFNRDGRLDLAVVNNVSTTVMLFAGPNLNNTANPGTASSPASAAAADFNHDGKLDLAVACLSGTVSLFPGNGDGTFQLKTDVTVQNASFRGIATGDFDHDGDVDLVVADVMNGKVILFNNNGAGSFTPSSLVAVGKTPFGIVTGDFDRDGWLDVAVANSGMDSVSVLRNDHAGSFTATPFNVGSKPESIAVADFNRDGRLDVAVANRGANNAQALVNTSQ